MENHVNVIIDRYDDVIILSYDSHAIGIDELEDFKEDIKSIYEYEIIAIPNAKITII